MADDEKGRRGYSSIQRSFPETFSEARNARQDPPAPTEEDEWLPPKRYGVPTYVPPPEPERDEDEDDARPSRAGALQRWNLQALRGALRLPLSEPPAPEANPRQAHAALLSSLTVSVREGRVSAGVRQRMKPAPSTPPEPGQPDLLSALPPHLKVLVALSLEPRSLASLACTCRGWCEAARKLWTHKLDQLEASWPASVLDARTLEQLALGDDCGRVDVWGARFAAAHGVANKLSATACTIPGFSGHQTKLFKSSETRPSGPGRKEKTGWDTLPGASCGSPFPSIALCRGPPPPNARADSVPTLASLAAGKLAGGGYDAYGQNTLAAGDAIAAKAQADRLSARPQPFSIQGSAVLPAGAYLIRWRVRSAPNVADRPPLRVTASASVAVAARRSAGAEVAADAAATSAAGLGLGVLAAATLGMAGPLVIVAAAASALAAGGAVAATVASNAISSKASKASTATLIPASSQLFEWATAAAAPREGGAASVRAAAAVSAAAAALEVAHSSAGAGSAGVDAMWRLDLEGELGGWRFVNVALVMLPQTSTVKVGMAEPAGADRSGLAVRGLAVDYCEFVALHPDTSRTWDSATDAVDEPEPAMVQY